MTQGNESELLAWFLTQEETGPGPSLLSRKGSALGRDFCPGAGCHGLGLVVRGKMKSLSEGALMHKTGSKAVAVKLAASTPLFQLEHPNSSHLLLARNEDPSYYP